MRSFSYAPSYLGLSEKEIREELKKDEILFYKEGLSQVTVTKRGYLLSLKIDAVEIDPAVVSAAHYFKDWNHNALKDPRVNMILADARNYLYLTNKKYDVISSGPSNPWVSGNAYLFTKEYYQLAKSHLKENGIMLQWIQYYSFWPEDLKTVFHTFQSVFPETYLFSSILTPDLLLVGIKENARVSPVPSLLFDDIAKKFEDQKIRGELARVYIYNPYELLSRLIGGPEAIREITKGIKIHTDDKPFLEFSAPQFNVQR